MEHMGNTGGLGIRFALMAGEREGGGGERGGTRTGEREYGQRGGWCCNTYRVVGLIFELARGLAMGSHCQSHRGCRRAVIRED